MDKKKRARRITADRVRKACTDLLHWHAVHGRHGLPWRRGNDPYAVLVSEFMLQQTTVGAVQPRFEFWMRRFPTFADLAEAPEQDVLGAWEGLGYYSRARRLHQSARAIVTRHGGILPDDEAVLRSLPGIGAYTAAALLAFAHDKPAVVLDTNITRVLSRWSDLAEAVDTAAGRTILRKTASSFFDTAGGRDLASALMDLGATLCISGHPRCSLCPLWKTCRATSPEKLPVKAPRPVVTKRTEFRGWCEAGGSVLLRQSPGPRWKGLWILPEIVGETTAGRPLAEIIYPITRFRVTMKVYRIRGRYPPGLQPFTAEELSALPMPTPHRKVVLKIISAIAAGTLPGHNRRKWPHPRPI